jgi:tRNA (cmo5U34)-methyltransferase
MGSHSVEDHLNLTVKDYDVIIRTLVPHYDELLSTGVEILEQMIAKKALVLDLGGGTGRLSQAVLNKLPEVQVELIDIDPKILDQARGRFAPEHKRIKFTLGSFFEALSSCDAIVASLSLHHVPGMKEKAKVYANIHKALRPGGLFLCLDASVAADSRISEHTFKQWTNHMLSHGITEEAARDHFDTWKKEEYYFSLHEELNSLAQVGFNKPECFWRKGPMVIYGALK